MQPYWALFSKKDQQANGRVALWWDCFWQHELIGRNGSTEACPRVNEPLRRYGSWSTRQYEQKSHGPFMYKDLRVKLWELCDVP